MFGLNDMSPGDTMDIGIKDVHESLGEESGSIHILVDIGVEGHGPQLMQPSTSRGLPLRLHFVQGQEHCKRREKRFSSRVEDSSTSLINMP